VKTIHDEAPSAARRCALYRHYDSADWLLYIGISELPIARGVQHARDAEWVQWAVRIEAVWFDSREEAEAAERAAIISERPIFNIAHNNRLAQLECELYRTLKPEGYYQAPRIVRAGEYVGAGRHAAERVS